MRGQIKEITFLMKAQAEVCPGSAIGALQISGWEIIKLNLFDQERPWHVSGWRGKTLVRRSNRSLFLMQRWKKCVFLFFYFSIVPLRWYRDSDASTGLRQTLEPLKALVLMQRDAAMLSAEMQLQHWTAPVRRRVFSTGQLRSLSLALVPLGPFTTIVSSRFEL